MPHGSPRNLGGVPRARNAAALAVLTAALAMTTPHTTASPTAFADALVSPDRDAVLTDAEDIYRPLLGAWEIETRDWMDDGTLLEGRGEWVFARVLEGRGIQDVFVAPPRRPDGRARAPHPRARYGTTVRVLDPATRR